VISVAALCYGANHANAQWAAGGANPGGTIPPGGTVPPPVSDPTQGQVRVLHLAPLATDIADTAIDLCDVEDVPVVGLSGLVYGENSGFLPFAAGAYDWYVGSPGCNAELLDLPPFLLGPDSAVTLLIVGGANGQPLNSILTVDRVGQIYGIYLPLIYFQ
jgi:hypothetical protein